MKLPSSQPPKVPANSPNQPLSFRPNILRNFGLLLTAFLALVICQAVQANFQIEYQTAGLLGDETFITPTIISGDVIATNLVLGPGLVAVNEPNAFASSSWAGAANIFTQWDVGNYLEFTVIPGLNEVFSSLSIGIGVSASESQNYPVNQVQIWGMASNGPTVSGGYSDTASTDSSNPTNVTGTFGTTYNSRTYRITAALQNGGNSNDTSNAVIFRLGNDTPVSITGTTFTRFSTTLLWTGNGGGNSFNSYSNGVSNWTNETQFNQNYAPLDGDTLQLAGSGQTVVNDVENLNLNRLLFNAGAGEFTVTGNDFGANQGVQNLSSVTQTIQPNLTINNGSFQALRAQNGDLVIQGNVSLGDSGQNGLLADAGRSLLVQGVHISSNNGFLSTAGDVTINGNISVANNNNFFIISGNTRLNGQAQVGSFNTSSGTLTLGHQSALISGFNEIQGSASINLEGNATISEIYGSSNTFINLGSHTLTLNATTEASPYELWNAPDFSGSIIGQGGALTKTGDGTQVLTGTNTHTGTTRIQSGSLIIGNGGTTGSLTGPVDIQSQGNLTFYRSNDLSHGGGIHGNGEFVKMGEGTLTLTGNSSFSGSTSILEGTLIINGTFGSGGTANVWSGATLGGFGTINQNVVVDWGGTLSSSLTVNGQVSLADQSFQGDVSAGTVNVASGQQMNITNATGGTINSGAGTVAISTLDGSTLNSGNWGASITNLNSGTVNTSGGSLVTRQGTFSGLIAGTGGLVKEGAGTLVLESENTYSGRTTVAGGVLEVASAAALGQSSAPVSILNDGRVRAQAGVKISQTIQASSEQAVYEKVFGVGESLENYGNLRSGIEGPGVTVNFGAGEAGEQTSVQSSFSAAGKWFLMGSVLSLDGLDGTPFLLVMNRNLPSLETPDEDIFLAWFDTEDALWKNAVLGNHEPNGSLAGFYAETSYMSFLDDNGGWNAISMLGAYGMDRASGQVWAVVDHNSSFAVVPEPSASLLLLLAGSAWLFRKRRNG